MESVSEDQSKITDDSSSSNVKHESTCKVDRVSSPETSCVICLGKLENKSFTDSCFHQFCFTCLLEWSKVKPECPLCKQPFKSIIHNVRSIEDYDQYHLRNEDSHNAWESPDGRRFRYRSTLTHERHCEIALERLLLGRVRHPSTQSWNRSRVYNRGWNRPCISNTEFRQTVYEQNWWALPIEQMQTRSRFRNVSPSFFHANPACTHRLVPWLNRELVVLLSNHESQISFVLELMLSLIQRYEIRSPEFHEHVHPYIFGRTDHFIHEFYNFARSPWDMSAYDRHVVYQNCSVHQTSSQDNDVIILSPSESISSTTVDNSSHSLPENNSSVIVDTIDQDEEVSITNTVSHIVNDTDNTETSHSAVLGKVKSFLSKISVPQEWDTPTTISFSPSWNSPVQTSSTTVENLPTFSHTPSPQPGPSGVTQATILVKESSDSDSTSGDDCCIVGYVKPIKERSPLIIDLVSDSNEDSAEENTSFDFHSGKFKRERYEKYRSSSSSREREYHSLRHKKRKIGRDVDTRHYRSRSSSSSSYTRTSVESRSKSNIGKHSRFEKSYRHSHKRRSRSSERWQWTAYENGGGKLQRTMSSSDDLSHKYSKDHVSGHMSRRKRSHSKHKHKKHKKHKHKHKSYHKDEKAKKYKD